MILFCLTLTGGILAILFGHQVASLWFLVFGCVLLVLTLLIASVGAFRMGRGTMISESELPNQIYRIEHRMRLDGHDVVIIRDASNELFACHSTNATFQSFSIQADCLAPVHR